mgnify:CR=1 FL=1
MEQVMPLMPDNERELMLANLDALDAIDKISVAFLALAKDVSPDAFKRAVTLVHEARQPKVPKANDAQPKIIASQTLTFAPGETDVAAKIATAINQMKEEANAKASPG